MNSWKVWIENLQAKPYSILGLLVLIALPITLMLVFRSQDTRSSAAAPDKLETESGVLSSSGATKQSDSSASGDQYILFNEIQSPTTTPISSSGKLIGSGINMTSLSNTRIGYAGFTHGTFRFKSEKSSTVEGLRVYMVAGSCDGGYAKGDGGMFKWSILPDNGNGIPDLNASPYSTYSDSSPIGCSSQSAGYYININGLKPLTSGKIYHIVAENIHPDPLNNYFSMNCVFINNGVSNPYFPAYPDNETGHYYKSGSDWIFRPGHLPIFELTFSDGSYQGNGYIEISNVNHGGETSIVGHIGGTNIIREKFTYNEQDKTISSAYIRVGKIKESGNITLKLKENSTIQRQTTISSEQIPTIATDNTGIGSKWLNGTFSPFTLEYGKTYTLEISAPSGSDYRMWPIRKGIAYNYHQVSYFYGVSEYSIDGGASWLSLGGHSGGVQKNQYDLQFYLK